MKRKLGLGKLGLGHKRTGSNDSKVSQGPFSLLGRSKQTAADQNTVCINGSHVYLEEHERKTGSTLSLNSSGKGSVEDVRRQHERNISDASTDSFKALAIPSYKPEAQERKTSVQQEHHRDEEQEKESEAKRQADEKLRLAEEKRRQAENKRIQEMLDRQEEQEKKRVQERQKKMEEEDRRRKREEEERKKLEEQERRRQEEDTRQAEEQERRRQEEARRTEEQRHHEETRVTDRLSSLFGLGRKKEEKKEEQQHPVAAPRHSLKELDIPASANPFEDISLTPDQPTTVQGPTEVQRGVLSPHAQGNGFPSRTAKVSAVKPR